MERRRQRREFFTNEGYIQGNTVRKLDIATEIQNEPKKKLSVAIRKNRDKAVHMNAGYVIFLAAALIFAGFVLVGYIQLQFDIACSIDKIAKMENQYMNLKLENDELYNRITNSIDLEEVKKVAVEELGMRYALEGQVVTIVGEGSDYVRQFSAIP